MKSLNIIVAGTLACDPYAGMAWMNLQIVLGLLRLGHNVYYFETTSAWPYNPLLSTRVDNTDYPIPYLAKLMEDFGIPRRWAYRASFSKEKEWFGLSKTKAEELLANADLVFNLSLTKQRHQFLLCRQCVLVVQIDRVRQKGVRQLVKVQQFPSDPTKITVR